MKLTLPIESQARKDVPVLSGCMNYFPAALAWIARISLKGDRKHNPENKGAPFHARGKSMDHGDCIVRHTMDIEDLKALIERDEEAQTTVDQLLEEAAYRAWRSCAELQELCEKYGGVPLAPAARLPERQFSFELISDEAVATTGFTVEEVYRAFEVPEPVLTPGDHDGPTRQEQDAIWDRRHKSWDDSTANLDWKDHHGR